MKDDEESLIEISDADIRAARRAWRAACDDDRSSAEADELLAFYERLVSAQAQQIAEQFRRANCS
jgi:hypothetical protein